MPLPDEVLPEVFTGSINPNDDACDAFRRLMALREQIGIFISWMFDEEGNLSDEFNLDLFKWVYGSLTCAGTGGNYILTSEEPYATPHPTSLTGRVVIFVANHASPDSAVGSNIILDGLDPVPLRNAYDVELEENDVRNGQVVVAVHDGNHYRIISGLSRISVDQIEGGEEGDFGRSREVGGKQVFVWEGYYRTADNALVDIPTPGTPATFTHGFGQKPIFWQVSLVCIVADLGYAEGDEVNAYSVIAHGATDDDYTPAIMANANEIRFCQASGETDLRFASKGGGAMVTAGIDPTKWKLRAFAMK